MHIVRLILLLHLEAVRDRVSYAWSIALPVLMFALFSRNLSQSGDGAAVLAKFLAYIGWSSALFVCALPLIWKRETGFFRSFCLGKGALWRVAIAHAVSGWLHALWMMTAFLFVTALLVPHALALTMFWRLGAAAALVTPLLCVASLAVLAVPGGFRAMSATVSGLFFVAFVMVFAAATPQRAQLAWISPLDWVGAVVLGIAGTTGGFAPHAIASLAVLTVLSLAGLALASYPRLMPTLLR